MKIRWQAQAALLLALTVAATGCARVQAKAALKDGNKAYKEENYKQAIEHYQKATQFDPSMPEAWFYLGSSHQALYRPGRETAENKQHLDLAIEFYKKSLQVNAAGSENEKKVKGHTLAALTGIYSDDPHRSFETAFAYAQQLVADSPNDPKNLYAMANLYEKFGHIQEAEDTYKKIASANPNDTKACGALAAFYNKPNWDDTGAVWAEAPDAAPDKQKPRRSKFEQAISVLEQCAALAPSDPSGWQKVATFYWDKAYRDPLLDDEQKNVYADKGIEAVDKALAVKPDYFEAIIFKGLLYRVKAGATPNPKLKAQYMEQAQQLQKQGMEIRKEQQAQQQAAPPSPVEG